MSAPPGAGAGLSPPPSGAASGSSPPDPLVGMLPEILRSGVSLAFMPSSNIEEETEYGTGFVVLSYKNHSFIFTSYLKSARHSHSKSASPVIFVQFHGSTRESTPAHILCKSDQYMVLTVLDDQQKGQAITLAQAKAGYERCCTIGTMSGTKLHASLNAPLQHYLGRLGTYFGKVITPDCTASTHCAGKTVVPGSKNYFMVSCPYKDIMMDFDNIDLPSSLHTCTNILGAPVIRSDGQLIGAISSTSTSFDVKYGLHVEQIIPHIEAMCLPMVQGDKEEFEEMDWKEKLMTVLELHLQEKGVIPGVDH